MLIVLVLLAILAAMTIASFVKLPDGAVRVFDVPRTQIAIASFTLGLLPIATGIDQGTYAAIALAVGSLIFAVQLFYIVPYTPVWPSESRRATTNSTENRISVLVSNVLQTNRQYARVASQITDVSPDVVLLMEVDQAWLDALSDTTRAYKWRKEVPLDNLYGMAIYSKLPLPEIESRCILRDGIPSISAVCRLENGEKIRLIAVHPEPPMPHQFTEERDAEIIIAGQMALKDPLPAIVTGDLNDVAWSHTTRRFRRLSQLLDPRVGRGLYNTFHASWPFLRWPIDHLFHDEHFSLVSMRRLAHVGSDHFPIFFELALERGSNAIANDLTPEIEDIEEAHELLKTTGRSPSET